MAPDSSAETSGEITDTGNGDRQHQQLIDQVQAAASTRISTR